MNKTTTKIRVLLSVDLLSALAASENQELEPFQSEINRVIKPALTKVGLGVMTTYTTTVKELTLEQKVKKGIATPEELEQYEKALLNSI